MKIYVTGANGQLGREIARQFLGKYELVLHDKLGLDITDYTSVEAEIRDTRPSIIINAAAFTKVEQAEDDPIKAFQINAIGAENLAIACKKSKVKLIHISTDYVFDGTKKTPYEEFDEANPLSVYGKSKLWGEKLIQQAGGGYFILRTSWLFGDGHNFVRTILRLADQGDELNVVADQYGTPTYTKDLVWVIEKLMNTDFYGIYHASNHGTCTWFDFAKRILAIAGKSVNVKPVSTEDYPVKALRPRYSVMKNYLLQMRGLDVMRSWEEALIDYIYSGCR